MKICSIATLLLLATLCACQKSNSDKPSTALFDGKKLEGKWNIVKTTVVLKFDDGTTQTNTRIGKPDEYLEFKYGKISGKTSSGTFTTFGLGTTSIGTWSLAEDKAALDFIYNATPAIYHFVIIDELDDHKLIVSADDKLVLLNYETNDLATIGDKKLVGGSIYEEYAR